MKKYQLALIMLSSVGLTMCTSNNDLIQNSEIKELDIHIDTTPEVQKSTAEKDTVKKGSTEIEQSIEFEKIEVGSIPDYESVMNILEVANLKSICADKKVDQLDIDLMFMKTAVLPFDQFKLTELSDGSNRTFAELFPEKELIVFYNKARVFLKTRYDKQ